MQPAARKLPSLWNCPEIWTENTLTIAAKLKKNISSSYCAVIASQNISLRCEGCRDTRHTFLIAWWQSCEKKPRCFRSPGPVTSFGKLSENLRVIQSILNIKSFLLCLPSTCHSQLVCQPYKMKQLCKQPGSYVQSY